MLPGSVSQVMTLWENAARSSMGEARLEELALQSPDGLIDTGALRQLRLDEQVADPVMSILTGDLLHMLLLEMCEVKVQALEGETSKRSAVHSLTTGSVLTDCMCRQWSPHSRRS